MRKLRKVDWLMFFGAIPLGGLLGAAAGLPLSIGVTKLAGTENSHNAVMGDLFIMGVVALLGMFVGPALVRRRWKSQSPY